MNQAIAGIDAGETRSHNPATGEDIGTLPNTPFEDIPRIFAEARKAQKGWAAKSFAERRYHVQLMRRYIVDNAEQIARVISQDNGKTRMDALATEVIPCSLACKWYGHNAQRVLRSRTRSTGSLIFFHKRSAIERVPLGVVGIISPWNYPLSIPFGEVVMALMAGNAVLLKVAAATPMVGRVIEEIVDAGNLPPGLFHHVVGSGGNVSTAMFRHGIDKIFFTGSVATGKQLMAQAAETLTPVSLELGGKDPMIVLEDADIERAANGAAWAGYQNAGQSCAGVERIYVHESVYDEFVSVMASKTRALRHGADIDFNVDIGSMTTAKQKSTVEAHLEAAVRDGARIVAQSRQVGEHDGLFHPATLVTDVHHEMQLMREETFGPVLPVMKFSTVDEAVALANDSTMALTSSVWTRDLKRGREIASRIHAGVTTINDHLYTHGLSELPWGGWKESGLGRTHGEEGLLEMTHAKCVNWDLLPARRSVWWYPQDEKAYRSLLLALRFGSPRDALEFVWTSLRLVPFLLRRWFTPWKTGG